MMIARSVMSSESDGGKTEKGPQRIRNASPYLRVEAWCVHHGEEENGNAENVRKCAIIE